MQLRNRRSLRSASVPGEAFSVSTSAIRAHYASSPSRPRSSSFRIITRAEIKRTALETVGQSKNLLWRKLRRNILTASNFGRAYRALVSGKGESLERFIRGWRDQQQKPEYSRQFDTLADIVPAIKWALDHELRAIRKYSKLRKIKVSLTGLWLSDDASLGASPDGLVKRGKGILEVKCPYSCRKLVNWEEAVETGLAPPVSRFLRREGK